MKSNTNHLRGSNFAVWLGLQLQVLDDQTTFAELTLGEEQEGPPGHSHGGVISALLDEAMGLAVWATGKRVLAVNLNVNFRRPVPLGVKIQVQGEVERFEGRKAFTRARLLLPDGTVAADSTGIFVQAPDHIVQNSDYMLSPNDDGK